MYNKITKISSVVSAGWSMLIIAVMVFFSSIKQSLTAVEDALKEAEATAGVALPFNEWFVIVLMAVVALIIAAIFKAIAGAIATSLLKKQILQPPKYKEFVANSMLIVCAYFLLDGLVTLALLVLPEDATSLASAVLLLLFSVAVFWGYLAVLKYSIEPTKRADGYMRLLKLYTIIYGISSAFKLFGLGGGTLLTVSNLLYILIYAIFVMVGWTYINKKLKVEQAEAEEAERLALDLQAQKVSDAKSEIFRGFGF